MGNLRKELREVIEDIKFIKKYYALPKNRKKIEAIKSRIRRGTFMVIALGLVVTGARGCVNKKEQDINDIKYTELAGNTEKKLLEDEYFNCNGFNCPMPNVLGVSRDTNINELLDKYYSAKANNNKKEITEVLEELKEKKDDFAQLNYDLLRAIIADGEEIHFENVDIKALFCANNVEDRKKIADGHSMYKGNTLRISANNKNIEALGKMGTFNYNAISKELFDLISSIRYGVAAKGYYEDNGGINTSFENYMVLKNMINEHYVFKIVNGKLGIYDEKGKEYQIKIDYKGRKSFEEIKLIMVNGDNNGERA